MTQDPLEVAFGQSSIANIEFTIVTTEDGDLITINASDAVQLANWLKPMKKYAHEEIYAVGNYYLLEDRAKPFFLTKLSDKLAAAAAAIA